MVLIADFFTSYIGRYVVQSFLHTLVAAVVVDRAMQAWDISTPLMRQRFRIMVVLLPPVLFPLYQLVNPGRDSLAFRMDALFDSSRWLGLEIWGIIPLSWPFLLIIAVTTLLFLLQELLPIIHHTFASGHAFSPRRPAPGASGEGEAAADRGIEIVPATLRAELGGKLPRVELIETDDKVLFSTTGKNAAVFISRGLIESLTVEEREVVLAHEIAHVRRNRRPLLVLVYLVRVLLFFNPVVLLEFRRIVQEEEKICDDIAAALTGAPRVLAATLKKLYLSERSEGPEEAGSAGDRLPSLEGKRLISREALEHYSHAVHIQSRVSRLEEERQWQTQQGGGWFPFAATLAAIAALNYFIV